MEAAGVRFARDDEQDMNREAVLLQWEQKIEAAERRPRRFERSSPSPASPSGAGADAVVEPAARPPVAGEAAQAAPEPRTITITAAPPPRGRRQALAERQLAEPDRIALWAFLLGLFLVAVAAGTAHA